MINELRHRTGPGHPGRPVERAPDRRLLILTGLASLLLTGIVTVWLIVPSTNLLTTPGLGFSPEASLLNTLVGPGVTTLVLLIAGLLGTGAAALLLARRSAPTPPATVIGFGLAQTVVVGLGLLTESAIMASGYLMALVVVAASGILIVQLIRRTTVGRWVALAGVAAVIAVFVTGVLPASALIVLAERIGGLAGQAGTVGTIFTIVAVALLWLLVATRTAQRRRLLDRPGAWVLRHRRVITILAALGPLPYCLLRLTWLTPWPYGMGDGLPPDIRIWGLLLSSGGWVGLVLTLGLISRWGEVFPRWMPFLAGRPVPVWCAAGPGSFVAAVLIASAVPMFRSFTGPGLTDALLNLVIFPFWFWGPMLALAVWGYVLHRRSAMASGADDHSAAASRDQSR